MCIRDRLKLWYQKNQNTRNLVPEIQNTRSLVPEIQNTRSLVPETKYSKSGTRNSKYSKSGTRNSKSGTRKTKILEIWYQKNQNTRNLAPEIQNLAPENWKLPKSGTRKT